MTPFTEQGVRLSAKKRDKRDRHFATAQKRRAEKARALAKRDTVADVQRGRDSWTVVDRLADKSMGDDVSLALIGGVYSRVRAMIADRDAARVMAARSRAR
jgi:hypothetical protein